MAKVYIVIKAFDYEGYSTPCGAFASVEVARAAIASNEYGPFEVFEVELDAPLIYPDAPPSL